MKLLYVTYSSRSEAMKQARAIIQNGHAACVNISSEVTSFYEWEDQIKEEREVVALYKVSDEGADNLLEMILADHPYEVPCALLIDIVAGNPDFIEWVENS